MKYISLATICLATALLATPEVNTVTEVFSEAKTSGNVKYYYIQTDKDKSYTNTVNTSAYANTLGGQLHFDTASLYGFRAGVTFMTTNPFLLGPNVDASIIGRDNGVRVEGNPSGDVARKGFSVLGEAYLAYDYKNMGIYVGREVIKTPLIDAKVVRLLPSAVEGTSVYYNLSKSTHINLAYYNAFKQRTSDVFINIIKHALGAQTKAITGTDNGYVGMFGLKHKDEAYRFKLYNYYASDFMNSFYIGGSYTTDIAERKLSLEAEYINQRSIGNADSYFDANSATYGGRISSNAIAFKASTSLQSAKIFIAYSQVFKEDAKHDGLVLPWDGTPLFTNMITSNDLFLSNYGKSMGSDSIYIGGSQGIKLGYVQKFDTFGLEGVSTILSYLNTSNSRFSKDQNDYNIVLQYKTQKAFTLQLKGILVQDNSSADAAGTITQLKQLRQYRVIANYTF